jgi:hypothetical protein
VEQYIGYRHIGYKPLDGVNSMKRNFFTNSEILKQKNRRSRRGAAIVETAFVVIILLTLTLGLIQWGILFNTSIAITNLSREGARYAAVNYEKDKPIKDYVLNNLPPNIRKGDVKIRVLPAEGSADRTSGKPIRVIVRYDMSKKLFLPNGIFGLKFFDKQYRADGRMMMEG